MAPWLQRYGNQQHQWQRLKGDTSERLVYERQIGLVETSFDVDGVHYGGRADLTQSLELEIRSKLSKSRLLDRIVLAWTALRLHHVLLFSRIEDRQVEDALQRRFVVDVPESPLSAVSEARTAVISMLDSPPLDAFDFRHHALNTARILDPSDALSKLFVLPLTTSSNGRFGLSLLLVAAHMIADGLSMFAWISHFVDLLNVDEASLKSMIEKSLDEAVIQSRLPPAQEDLYPPVAGSKARQRWFWAIVRVMRHVRKPLPAGFVNPLRRVERTFEHLDPKYKKVLDYSKYKSPPLNSGSCTPEMSLTASQQLAAICKEARTTVGAGVYALVAAVMMEMEEKRHPDILPAKRAPFIASFPLNPRPWFYDGPHDSCMLAFSDGIVMPFLPSDLPLKGRIRLLAKIAHRQLKTYQKRKTLALDSHSPIRTIATNFLSAVERAEDKLPPQYRTGVNPQGSLPANVTFQAATCGVSSVGSVKHWVAPGKYNLSESSGKDLVADFRTVKGGVRARDNEFLCGNSSDVDGRLSYLVSYDLSAMDEKLVQVWKNRIETILEPSHGARL